MAQSLAAVLRLSVMAETLISAREILDIVIMDFSRLALWPVTFERQSVSHTWCKNMHQSSNQRHNETTVPTKRAIAFGEQF